MQGHIESKTKQGTGNQVVQKYKSKDNLHASWIKIYLILYQIRKGFLHKFTNRGTMNAISA